MHYGVDLSSYQTLTDAKAMVADLTKRGKALPFAILNAADPTIASKMAALRSQKIALAVYWFADPNGSPENQAAAALRFGLPVACDLEVDPITAKWINAFLDTVAKGGQPVLWYDSILVEEALASQVHAPRWLAAPSYGPTEPLPLSCVCQQLAAGPVDGINGDTDIDVWRGDEASFRAFFKLGAPKPPPRPAKGMDMDNVILVQATGSAGHWPNRVVDKSWWLTDGFNRKAVGSGAIAWWTKVLGGERVFSGASACPASELASIPRV